MLQRSCTTILALIEPLVAEIWCTLENVGRWGDEDSRPGPQNRDFWQVVEIEPNRILACRFRHTHWCNLIIRLKPSAKSRTYGIDVCWGRQKWQLSVSIYSTLATRCLFFWEGRHPLSRVLDRKHESQWSENTCSLDSATSKSCCEWRRSQFIRKGRPIYVSRGKYP